MQIQLFLISLFTLLLYSGCAKTATTETPKINKTRFQTVAPDQATLVQVNQNKTSCAVCGMHLPTFYKTNHAADTKYGPRQYCSLHCVVHDNELNKTDLKNLKVVDTNRLQFIPALDAFYVVGSKKAGTMSRVSKYAFLTKKDAQKFAKTFGGEVMEFYDAYGVATKDFTKH
ncbi:MAG: nitrous oxide reductase accessory protein NosL [Epsilonproteobacteria bacterium]|nr:nitrous oxide reductase accessory protein NosL [Campylobacterota bacterium]